MNNLIERLPRYAGLVFIVVAIAMIAKTFSEPPVMGKSAPDFQKVVLAGTGIGDEVQLSKLRGEVLVLEFWASWCSACKQSMPMMNEVYGEYGPKGVHFFGVNTESLGPRRLEQEHERFGMKFGTIQDGDGALSSLYGVSAIPTVVVIGRDGVVHFASTGSPRSSKFRNALDEALSGSNSN
ncbi:MAG: TlpA disulfide reductase family protein [Polyangiales bacterium]